MKVNLSVKSQPFIFSRTKEQEKETTAVQFVNSPVVNFIPVEMFDQFPSLNGLQIDESTIPILKNELFTTECEKIEFLDLDYNEIEVIEPLAFRHLMNLKWVGLDGNLVKSLNDQIFAFNIHLTSISFWLNNIEMINKKLFIYLNELKVVDLEDNECADNYINCASDYCIPYINEKFQRCFQNCGSNEKCKNASETRVKIFNNKTNLNEAQLLNCTFFSSSFQSAQLCEIEEADLTNDTRYAEFTFSGSELKKKKTDGALFSRCFDVDFVPKQIFREFPSLNRLDVSYSYIPVLTNYLFTPEFSKIKYLWLTYDQINTIESEAFQHLRNLKFVNLAFNDIEVIKSDIFKENRKLEYIYLAHNKIKMLNKNLFHGLKNLAVIDFEQNECAEKYNAYEFKDLKGLSTCYENCESDEECKKRSMEESEVSKEIRSIFCNYNRIDWKNKKSCLVNNTELRTNLIYEISNTNDKASKIRAIYFQSSPVTETIPNEIIKEFPNLDSVGFQKSSIPILKAGLFTSSFKKIEEIRLKENGIQQIENEAFHELENLREIDLSFNKIKSINKELFIQNPNLKLVNLYRNKIFMIQRDSFKQQVKLDGLNFLGNECIDTNFGCDFLGCAELDEIDKHLENCHSNYTEQERKFIGCKFLV
jgi:Leucine-rich repeat (LRR) protein